MNLSPELIAQIMAVVIIVNSVLSGVKVALEKIAPTTETTIDDGALSVVGWIIKALDFITGNVAHK